MKTHLEDIGDREIDVIRLSLTAKQEAEAMLLIEIQLRRDGFVFDRVLKKWLVLDQPAGERPVLQEF